MDYNLCLWCPDFMFTCLFWQMRRGGHNMGPFGAVPAAAPPVAPALELRSCCTKRPCWSSASTVEVGRAGAVLHGEKAQPVELKKNPASPAQAHAPPGSRPLEALGSMFAATSSLCCMNLHVLCVVVSAMQYLQ